MPDDENERERLLACRLATVRHIGQSARVAALAAETGLGLLLGTAMLGASPVSHARTTQRFSYAYDPDFDRAYAAFADAASIDPADPAPHRAEAAVAWIETLFAQGAGTFEAFTAEIGKLGIPRPSAPAQLVARFQAAINAAADLSSMIRHCFRWLKL